MTTGYLSLVLHAHLPFVHHPEEDRFFEENWLFEAITETYIPLLQVFQRLVDDRVAFQLTLSLTPSLLYMLQNPLLQARYLRYLDHLIELSTKEVKRTRLEPAYYHLACWYQQHFIETKQLFIECYEQDLVSAFRCFQTLGHLEILASCATHGFLPHLSVNHSSVVAQVQLGVACYQQTFGQAPVGFWLPECGFYPGLDDILKQAGIEYFFVDGHGLTHANPAAQYGVHAPVVCPSGVVAFGRDNESSKQVWCATVGYPGDPDYREYYRDLGHELDYDYIKPYIHPLGARANTGIKYWRITGNTEQKAIYDQDKAQQKAMLHADDFIKNRGRQMSDLTQSLNGQSTAHPSIDRKPLVIAPYDAELFGHWWFEGPIWLEQVIRKIHRDPDQIKLLTPSTYLAQYSQHQVSMPSLSSWGDKGYHAFWVNETNDWIYPHLHMAGQRMQALAHQFAQPLSGHIPGDKAKLNLLQRALNQAARELLLAESSDWAFIMTTQTMVPYAHRRVRSHINRFNRLYDDLLNHNIDSDWLAEIERRDNIFHDINCAQYYQ